MTEPAQIAESVAVWGCKIGPVPRHLLPHGSDGPMREAVARAFKELTGLDDEFLFSGWGASLTEPELAVVEDRLPDVQKQIHEAEERPFMLTDYAARNDGRGGVGTTGMSGHLNVRSRLHPPALNDGKVCE